MVALPRRLRQADGLCDRQAGVAQERVGQVRRAADPLDALVGLPDHLGQGRAGELASSTALRLDHRPSTGLSSGA